MMKKPQIDYTSKDYEGFRNDMINLIPQILPTYTDYSESDAGIMMIEAFAYMGDILSYYQDRRANEVYLPTATQLKSVLDISKMLGYQLKTATASRTKVYFTLATPAPAGGFVVPKGFAIGTKPTDYEPSIQFETVQDLFIPQGAKGNEKDAQGNYLYLVDVIQGITIPRDIIGASSAQPNMRFALKYADVLTDSVRVYVNEGTGDELWADMTDDPIGTTLDGKFYQRELDENGFTWIVFGDGLRGKIPTVGFSNIAASYRVGGGRDKNVGANTINTLLDAKAGIVEVNNPTPSIDGTDMETIEQAKVNAPKLFKTQNRAVTMEDYENISRSVIGVAKARAVADEKQTNAVKLTVAPIGGGQPSPALINLVFQTIDAVKVLTTKVILEAPKYIGALMTLEVEAYESANNMETKTFVTQALRDLFDFDTISFGEGVPISRIYRELMNIDSVYSVNVRRLTTVPLVEGTIVSGNPTFGPVEIKTTATYEGKWKVVMTSPTAFTVNQLSYDSSGKEVLVPKGTGTMGTKFTDTGNMISFTITAGTVPCAPGDNWKFKTFPYLSNIAIEPHELLVLAEDDLQITVTGGRG